MANTFTAINLDQPYARPPDSAGAAGLLSACGKRTGMVFVVNLTGALDSAEGELRSHLGATEGEDSSAWPRSG